MQRTSRLFTARHFAGRRNRRAAFTLVELLVVITIIGILISLLMPAVQSAREAARKNTCANWLKQFGTAALNHETSQGFFPTGGWGTNWVGDPDQGATPNQPGGWLFNLLPYMDGAALHDMASGQSSKSSYLGQMIATSQPYFNCPSRRRNTTYPCNNPSFVNATISGSPAMVAKCDYAANAGDSELFPISAGPSSVSGGAANNAFPTDPYPNGQGMTGVSYLRSQVTQAAIIDGATNTYFAGERYLDPNHYEDGSDPADGLCALSGWSYDLYRDAKGGKQPYQDNLNGPNGATAAAAQSLTTTAFGSAHPGGLNMVFCDGSVHSISYSIDPTTQQRLANRADGLPVDASKWNN